MITDWHNVSISKYKELKQLGEDYSDSSIDSNVEATVRAISILNNDSEDNVWNYTMGKLNELTKQLSFLRSFPEIKKKKYKKLKIGELELEADVNMKEFTVAQHLDFQSVWSEEEKDLARLIAVFYIPKGRKYNDGYDVVQLIQDIEESIDIVTANEISFFLCRKLLKSTLLTRSFLSLLAKRTSKKIQKLMKNQ